MDSTTKVALGVGVVAGIGVLLLIKQREAAAMLLASQAPNPPPLPASMPTPTPASSPAFMVLPPSQNAVSRTESPPANAVVPPGDFIAVFTGLRLSTKMEAVAGSAIGPVPEGTLLADASIFTSEALRKPLDPVSSRSGAFPVSWVSPDGERIAIDAGSGGLFGNPGGLLIAHRGSMGSGGIIVPSFSL